MMPSAKPMVDDQYWFDVSKEMVKNSDAKLDEAISKLKTLILWLWGIYTTSATVGVTVGLHFFKTTFHPLIITLMASPSAILILAYCLAVCAEMPIQTPFDPRIAKDINMAYNKQINSKTWRLYLALFFALIAAILVSFALRMITLGRLEIPFSFEATIVKVHEQTADIAFSGHFPKGVAISLRIIPLPTQKYPDKQEEFHLLASQTSGELQT